VYGTGVSWKEKQKVSKKAVEQKQQLMNLVDAEDMRGANRSTTLMGKNGGEVHSGKTDPRKQVAKKRHNSLQTRVTGLNKKPKQSE
jgi:hypothetical protein